MYSEAIVINAMEEMAELIQALCKTLRLMLGDKTLRKTEKEVSAMVDEEIAEQDVIHQLINEHEKLQKAHKKLLSLWGKDLNTWRDETSQLLQDAGFEDASKYLDAAWEL